MAFWICRKRSRPTLLGFDVAPLFFITITITITMRRPAHLNPATVYLDASRLGPQDVLTSLSIDQLINCFSENCISSCRFQLRKYFPSHGALVSMAGMSVEVPRDKNWAVSGRQFRRYWLQNNGPKLPPFSTTPFFDGPSCDTTGAFTLSHFECLTES